MDCLIALKINSHYYSPDKIDIAVKKGGEKEDSSGRENRLALNGNQKLFLKKSKGTMKGGRVDMKRIIRCFLAVAFLAGLLFISHDARAGEIDILVDKLVDKGVLSPGEAQQILTETKEEVRKEVVKGTYSSLPEWIQNMKLKGDLRIRYQWEDKHNAEDRHRGRYRFRLGLHSKVNDKLNVAAGLATGGADGRSTNQTMGGKDSNGNPISFQTPDIRLDYAYAEWLATDWATLRAGKVKGIKSEIFRPSDLLWDSDLHPEGLTIALAKKMNDVKLFANTGVWILGENSSDTSDPMMVVFQPGFEAKMGKAKLAMGVAGYFFNSVKGDRLSNGGDTSGSYNSLDSGNHLKYDYNAVSPSFKLSVKEPFGGSVIETMKFYGDYVHNPDPSEDNNGGLVGIGAKFGGPLQVFGKSWDLDYSYRYLEKDAWLDIFPDSDAYSGHTDVKGHEVKWKYPLGKNTSLGLDYYYMERIGSTAGRKHVLQADWGMKF